MPDRRLALRIPDLAVPVAKHHGATTADIQLPLAHQFELQGKTVADRDIVGIHAGDIVALRDRYAGVRCTRAAGRARVARQAAAVKAAVGPTLAGSDPRAGH